MRDSCCTLVARGLRAEVSSAGVEAAPDRAAHPLSVHTVAAAGLGDLSSHRTRLLSSRLVGEADFVLCMEHAHRDAIVARAPEAAGRVRLLGHWQGAEITDPVDGTDQDFVECLKLLNTCIDEWLTRLARMGLLR